ncbi:MAG: metallophosphoesterase [Bacteroidota bacterium]
MKPQRYLVVSDLHMTSGKDPHSGVWAPTEDFFWDEEFRDFLAHYSAGGDTTLIINGDLFDFLKVLVFPTPTELTAYGIPEADVNRAYGLRCSESAGVFQIDKIVDGHPLFFRALVDFLLAGNRAIILKGNHDIQLFWGAVRERVYARLEGMVPAAKKKTIRKALEFLPWCYYVPGLLYVEHGNQYEYTTSFRNFLNPELPVSYPGTSKQIELDLSGFLVRYVLNRLKPIDPLSDSIRPQSKYFQMFFQSHPFTFIMTIGTTLKYILKAFAKARELGKGSLAGKIQSICEENLRLIGVEAKRFSAGDEESAASLEKRLRLFDERKATPVLTSGAWSFLWMEIRTPLKGLLMLLPLYVLIFVVDLNAAVMSAITDWSPSFWKSLLEGICALKIPQIAAIALLGMGMIWIYRRSKRRKKAPSTDDIDVGRKVRGDAQFIARELGVKFVTFGHTHYADIFRCSEDAWYFNTGTWMTIFSPEEQIYRDAHQFTYLEVENGEAQLLRWNPDRMAPQPVRVVDTEPVETDSEDGILKVILGVIGIK